MTSPNTPPIATTEASGGAVLPGFVHLRVHTAYSLSEGAIRIPWLAETCRAQGMPAVAMTDTGNLFGAMEFSKVCAAQGIQPILGAQVALRCGAEDSDSYKRPAGVVVLVQDLTGYGNLLKLMRRAYLDVVDAQQPHVTVEDLTSCAAGLILLSGGPTGPLGRLIGQGQGEQAEQVVSRLKAAYGDRFYVELQRHGLADEARIETGLLDLAYAQDIPLVATNEAFFPSRDMYDAHDALICIAEGAYVIEEDRRRLTPEHFLKSPQEMCALFADIPEATANTLVIAQRCAFLVEHVDPLLPPYDCGAGRSETEELAMQSRHGLAARLDKVLAELDLDPAAREAAEKPYYERLEFELQVISDMGFAGYFLIVADFIQWAKQNNIPVGPGRGSGAASVVAWSMTITDLDPLRFGLLFERFLNPERISMPDFDIDFCQDRRDEVIRYVQNKYGYDRVAQIITFGKLQARAVLRDVGRVLQLPYPQVDRICKLVPNDPAKPATLSSAIDSEPQLRQEIDDDPKVARMVQLARQLEGLYRHASTHAAGVVIGDRPLDQLIPLYRDPRSDMPVTQYNMKYVEDTGLIKFDFLGLKTLTVLSTALTLLGERGITLDLSTLPMDDPATFEMLSRAETTGVFQLESAGMRDVLKKLRPDCFEDMIAVVALYRPGPMDNIPSYIKRKHGEDEPDYLYPTLKPILEETYGIMIYQEQVLQIAQELAGYTLGGADLLRRAMGKKIASEMARQRDIFVDGAEARGVPRTRASEIFDQVAKFADYGFNKAHAAAYALIAYQTAYLKANYPVEFVAASMTLDIHNTDKLNVFRQELDRVGVRLLSPDVNRSDVVFRVEPLAAIPESQAALETATLETESEERPLAIRYALAAVKNVGAEAMRALVVERQSNGRFADLFDFIQRLDTSSINRRQLENLVRAGALDGLNVNRRQLYDGLDVLMGEATSAAAERNSGQFGLFGADCETRKSNLRLPDIADWPLVERLRHEFEAVGFYLSAHPLDGFAEVCAMAQVAKRTDILTNRQGGPAKLAGTVISKKERTSAKGNRFAFVALSDQAGVFEVTMFSEQLATSRDLLVGGRSVLLNVLVQFEDGAEGEPRYVVNRIEPLEHVHQRQVSGVTVYLEGAAPPIDTLRQLLHQQGRGNDQVRLISPLDDETEVEFHLGQHFALSPDFLMAIKATPGVALVEVHSNTG